MISSVSSRLKRESCSRTGQALLADSMTRFSGETQMPRWLTDKMTWLVLFAAIAAASSSYSAYKIYLMTDGKPVLTKAKR
jgi:hypothetical protein